MEKKQLYSIVCIILTIIFITLLTINYKLHKYVYLKESKLEYMIDNKEKKINNNKNKQCSYSQVLNEFKDRDDVSILKVEGGKSKIYIRVRYEKDIKDLKKFVENLEEKQKFSRLKEIDIQKEKEQLRTNLTFEFNF
ncbi:hypothetical protein FDF74_03735 [Clostridium niameyense]|uniref:Uncharacterized protein n=1 Tax=Clostridium niameyense TaxID=1622073 RepID=A0A6M0R7W0_9CLOT|nr:hypothetical protein [Clostridium niameyense]NEZ46322.1 hypothetical protein [Clostridium niameyense]